MKSAKHVIGKSEFEKKNLHQAKAKLLERIMDKNKEIVHKDKEILDKDREILKWQTKYDKHQKLLAGLMGLAFCVFAVLLMISADLSSIGDICAHKFDLP